MNFKVSRDQKLAVLGKRRYVFVPKGTCAKCAFDIRSFDCRLARCGVRERFCGQRDRGDGALGHWKETE